MSEVSPERALASKAGASVRESAVGGPNVCVMEERTLTNNVVENHTRFGVVLGCPGCNMWQVETNGAPMEDIEEVLIEHARECPPLTRIAMSKAIPIYPRAF